jgi:hypothetical protein
MLIVILKNTRINRRRSWGTRSLPARTRRHRRWKSRRKAKFGLREPSKIMCGSGRAHRMILFSTQKHNTENTNISRKEQQRCMCMENNLGGARLESREELTQKTPILFKKCDEINHNLGSCGVKPRNFSSLHRNQHNPIYGGLLAIAHTQLVCNRPHLIAR